VHREERREACIEFLTAYSGLREAILAEHERTGPRPPGRLKPVEYAPEAAARFNRAHHTLHIAFGDPVARLEGAANVDIWLLCDDVHAAPAEFDRMWAGARASRVRLHEAMRETLYGGVEPE
jgi:hypothetical protein